MLQLSKLTSPQEFDWEQLLTGIIRIILQEKRDSPSHHYFVHKFVPFFLAVKILDAKIVVEKEERSEGMNEKSEAIS